MAKYCNLEYHEDTVEKHKITKEEIKFLQNLQNEMNTQDNVGQANPRYWVIRDYEKSYGKDLNNPDGICVYDSDRCDTIFEEEYTIFGDEELADKIMKILEEKHYELSEHEKEAITDSYDLSSLCEVLEDLDFTVSEFEEHPVENGFFLTNKAAQDHLKSNDYHYSDKDHTYAHTAWRSKEKRLWDILQKVDFLLINLEEVEYGS